MKKRCYFVLLLLCCISFLILSARAEAKANPVSTFCTVKGKTYYYNRKGEKVKDCLKSIKGKTYYFDKKGVMQTGWQRIKKKRCYFYADGSMAVSAWISGKYLSASGVYKKNPHVYMSGLQTLLRKKIKSYKGTWSIYVKNLNTGRSFAIHDTPMYAASLIKLYAMAAAYDRIEKGKLKESSVRYTLNRMITVSSNEAFNTILQKVGSKKLNNWCQKNAYLETRQVHGLTKINNSYTLRTGEGSNETSVTDCGRLLESIYMGTCVSSSASSKMLSLLKQQTRRSKIPAGVPAGITVANKTGETDDYTHDAAIVYGPKATYILCVMGYCPGSAWTSASCITEISRLVYEYLNY